MIRETISNNSSDNQGVQRSLDNVLLQLRSKQQELGEVQDRQRKTEEEVKSNAITNRMSSLFIVL
jgi:hypothetical protein